MQGNIDKTGKKQINKQTKSEAKAFTTSKLGKAGPMLFPTQIIWSQSYEMSKSWFIYLFIFNSFFLVAYLDLLYETSLGLASCK